MFDVAFSEMLLIAIVALIVIGPQRLPKVARTAGVMLGRLQRYVSSVKADINREMQLDELRRLQAELAESARQLETGVKSELADAQRSLDETAGALNAAAASVTDGVAPPAAAVAASPTAVAATTDSLPSVPAAPWTAESFAATFASADAESVKAAPAAALPVVTTPANESKA
jgi:sec-independent protein translocase protein TatB